MRTLFILALTLAMGSPQQVIFARYKHHGGGGGGMVVVSATACQNPAGGGSGSFNCTIPSTTAGNTLLYACSTTVSDTLSGTTPASTALMTHGGGTANTDLAFQATANISGGLTSVNIQNSNAFAEVDCVVAEVSGFPTTITVDQTTGVTGAGFGTGSATNFTGAVTTTHAADTIFGIISGPPLAWVAGTGYTLVGQANGASFGTALEFLNVTSTGTYNPGFTWTGGNFTNVATTAVEQ